STGPSMERDMIRHRHVDTNGIRMHVAEAGPDDGPAVVLCHGFPECWYSWRHQLRALGDAGYHVLAPDQRGYGTTDMPARVDEYTQLHLIGDIVRLLAARSPSSATSSACSTRAASRPGWSWATTGAARWRGTAPSYAPSASRPSPRSA